MRAVVVGAGIGGAAATLLLAKAGVDTVLVEKNPRIGGSCSYYTKRGFHVDIGTHMFCRGDKGPLGEVLRRAGYPGAIPFVRTRDISEMRVVGSDQVLRTVRVPAAVARMPKFCVDMVRAMELTPRDAVAIARFLSHILAMSDAEVEEWDDRTVEEFLLRFSDAQAVVSAFGFLLGLFFVLPYWEVSAGEALWCFRRLVLDNSLSYPLGGSVRIPSTYLDLAQRNGARLVVGQGVERVVVRDGAVRAVVLEDGTELLADAVVSTSSLRTTAHRMVGAEHFPSEWLERVDGLRASYIAVQAKIALDRPLVTAGSIVGGVGEGTDLLRLRGNELKVLFESVASGRIPAVVPFYCPVPTNFDPRLGPPGHQLLTVCAVAPTTDIALVDAAPDWEAAMMHAVERVVPGLMDHALFVDKLSVRFIEHWIGKEFGPAISTGQVPGQVGRKRPPTWTPVHGLYVCGCGAGARGVGTELAAASAIECVDRLLVDAGRGLTPTATRVQIRRRALRMAARPVAWVTRPRQRADNAPASTS